MSEKIKKLIKDFGEPYSLLLGINLKSKKESEIFKWFLASILFGKRITESIAINTYKEFVKNKILTPRAIIKAGWNKLVKILDDGSYIRYDYLTATKLLRISKKLLKEYGSLTNLHKKAKNSEDLENRLQEFYGIGPITTNIFLRELRAIWKKANPEPCDLVKLATKNLRINLKKFNWKTDKFIKLEVTLLRVGKNIRKRRLKR